MKLDLKKICREKIVVFDGAMGTSIQNLNLSKENFQGQDGCNEILNISSPNSIKEIHANFLDVGCDFIETNTFGANGVILSEYGLEEKIYEINQVAAKLAKEVANDFSTAAQPRFVAGSIGPGTKLPSLRQVNFTELQQAYMPQIDGLIDGGVDLLIIETSQDILQLKAVLISIFEIFQKRKIKLPVIAQVTMETTGKTLVGSDIQTVIVSLSGFDIDALGLNCSTGPKPMTGHLRAISQHWDRLISVMPNAGLPVVEDGKMFYDMTSEELASDLEYFVDELGVNIVGGCCGTTFEHMGAVVNRVAGKSPFKRKPEKLKAAASLYSISNYQIEPKPLIIGERCNANGSKIFREYLLNDDIDGMLSVARKQEKESAHILDISTAYVGQDEVKSMAAFVENLNTDVMLPVMIDSTRPEVIENALQRISGKAIINSVNLEDEDLAREILHLCKKFGAGIVALTIDEKGMAKTTSQKYEIAKRLYKIIVEDFNIPAEDIFIDTLTFTLGSGDEETRNAAVETMEAIREIKKEMPDVNTILGVSNVSFGLKPLIRHRLNSVFLSHAIDAGLDAAILHAGKIMPLYRIQIEERKLLEDLLFNRRKNEYDPLIEVINFYKDKKSSKQDEETDDKLPIAERLKKRIIDGSVNKLEEYLDECLGSLKAIDIINNILLEAMKEVGELFGSGEMQLPFVLQSAETMKAAVTYLQPHLEKTDSKARGKILLATVKGDVHDIGKNLVDIILSNNGFEVINLGIKQNIESIVAKYREVKSDAIGMSGLLVKSTLIMKENLEALNRFGIDVPVILGGAALTRNYVENDLCEIYQGQVFYAKDAFDGLTLMKKITSGQTVKSNSIKQKIKTSGKTRSTIKKSSLKIESATVPVPPFWGRRKIEGIPLAEIIPFINKKVLFNGRWKIKNQSKQKDLAQHSDENFPEQKFEEMIQKAINENLITPRIVYGYFPCNSAGDSLLVYNNVNEKEDEVIFSFPRQEFENGLSLADYFKSLDSGIKDMIALQLVTVGKAASEEANRLYQKDRYQDYLFWHGFSVEFAEAIAEYWHQQIRRELKIDSSDSDEMKKIFSGNYQGKRYSFGYPACPVLEDQKKIFKLLKPEEIGVSLTEESQLVPEQSTSAIIIHHPQAKYFKI